MSNWKKIDPGWKWDDKFIFSQAIQVGNTIYLSGQVALDPDGNVVGIKETRRPRPARLGRT
ncbi:MAG TPA: RidA family protein [Thermodesulfobacteriota bacterium]|nr:RidA family protein [Thermodesulfobacteriota bacterium]